MQRGIGRAKGGAAAAVVALGLLILLWGTGEGRGLVRPPQGDAELPGPGEVPTLSPPPDVAAVTTIASEGDGMPAIDWGQVAIALFLILVLGIVLKWLLSRDWEQDHTELDDEPVGDRELLLEATGEAARARVLAEGDPRNAVVACWVALEDAAERGGMLRDPAETSAEFTRRVLATWSVDEPTLDELAALYREARFSRREITPDHRDRAVAAMESVHDQLRHAREVG